MAFCRCSEWSLIREYWLTHPAASYYFSMPWVKPPTDEQIATVEEKHKQYQADQVCFYTEGLDYVWKQILSFYGSGFYWQDTIVSKFVVTPQIRDMWSTECLLLRDFDSNDLVYEAEYKRRQWATTVQQHPDFFNIMMLTDFTFRKRIQILDRLLKEDGSQVVWSLYTHNY